MGIYCTRDGINRTHGGAAHCRVVCLLLVSVLVCFRFLLNLRSRSDPWFSRVCGVRVCVRAVCRCVCLGAVHFLHLSLQPARPILYTMSAFYRPFRALVTIPTGERHTCLLLVSVLVCFRFLLNQQGSATAPISGGSRHWQGPSKLDSERKDLAVTDGDGVVPAREVQKPEAEARGQGRAGEAAPAGAAVERGLE